VIRYAMMVFAGLVVVQSNAFAGDCAIRIDRTPFPGKEAEAWGIYGGRNPTAEVRHADSAAQCKELAKVNCTIKRKDVLKKKAVNAMFDGADIDGGADLCK
jgi:hypothetical protein